MRFSTSSAVLLVVSSLIIASNPSPVGAAPPAAPTQARLVDYFDQLGIDTATPRFGWVVNDADRAEKQTAYQIVVAAGPAALNATDGLLWDSGKVASAQQFGIAYAGTPLVKTTKYAWKVRTWDKDDQPSPWSETRDFVTSFFQPGDWNAGAKWIQHPTTKPDDPVMFRKTFSTSKPIKHAQLYITGLGQFVASLNGKKVGDNEIDPAWTHYDYTVKYVTFDVTSQLVRGTNAIGVAAAAGWLHRTDNGKLRSYGPNRTLAQLHIEYADGTSDDVVTDPTWKASTSPFTYADVHGVENYDARLEQPGWDTAGFKDATWVEATVSTHPVGELLPQSAPPVRTLEVLPGKNISSPSANNFVFDLGKNMNGQFEIKVNGKAGDKVTMTPGEFLNGNKTVNPGRSKAMTYTLKGGRTETWRQTFSTIGMRYVQVGGVSTVRGQGNLPQIQGVTGYFTYSASRNVGTFKASDERYNQIYQLVLNALRSNLTSLHTDCPNLEKLGWQEVVWTTLPSYVYQHDVYNVYAKIMRDVRDGQRTSGQVACIAPNLFVTKEATSGGKYDDAPLWGSSLFNAPWHLYQTYGDTKILVDNYEAMQRYLAYLKGRESDGLITYDGLGDWMAPAGHMVRNTEGAVYVMDTRIMRDVATVLGNTEDAATYDAEYKRVRDNYNKAYFDEARGVYNPVAQGTLAMPLEWGVVPEGRERDVSDALVRIIAQPEGGTADGGKNGDVRPNHITVGDVGTTFLWRALGNAGQHDLVQTMIMQPTSPSYMSMINAGETALAENWNLGNIRSHNHDMLGGIFEWMYRTPGGISSLEPGYAKVQLKPGMPTGLASVTATYDSVRGLIESAWTVKGNQVTWTVRVPVNATARVCVPARGTPVERLSIKEGTTAIFAGGKPTGTVPGLTFDRVDGEGKNAHAVWTAGSGTYRFAWQIAPAAAE